MVSTDEEIDIWIGETFKQDEKCKYYSKFTRTRGELDLFSVSTGDYVYIRDLIGLVTSLWENINNGTMEVEVRNCYRPYQTFEGVKPYHGNAQLLLSVIISTHPTYAIQGRVRFSEITLYKNNIE
jgi:hypothetical protein